MAAMDAVNLARLYDAHGAALVLYARQLVQHDLAQEVVQEVFVRLMAQDLPPRNVKAWLFRSVRNAALSLLRSHRRRRRREVERAVERPEAFENRVDDLIDARLAHSALESLQPPLREVVVLRIWAGLTLEEAAQTLGLPTTTVFRCYREALTLLRKRLSPCKTQSTS